MIQPGELLLLLLDSSAEPIAGRTAVQKIAYFNTIKLRLDLRYRPHFYGPYSPIVDETLMDLVSSDYVEEISRRTIRDRVLYSYELTDDGLELVKQIKKRDPSAYTVVRAVANKCNRAGNNINVLSWAAKVYFLLSQKGFKTMSYDEAIETGRRFNWKLSEEEIDSGFRLLSSLGLASKSD
jgi:hypothetical protein